MKHNVIKLGNALQMIKTVSYKTTSCFIKPEYLIKCNTQTSEGGETSGSDGSRIVIHYGNLTVCLFVCIFSGIELGGSV